MCHNDVDRCLGPSDMVCRWLCHFCLSVDVGLFLLFLYSNDIACACGLEALSVHLSFLGMSNYECALLCADTQPVCRAGLSGSHLSWLCALFEVLEVESTVSSSLLDHWATSTPPLPAFWPVDGCLWVLFLVSVCTQTTGLTSRLCASEREVRKWIWHTLYFWWWHFFPFLNPHTKNDAKQY